jgi:hypothetical protein
VVKLNPRPEGYDPLKEMHLEKQFVRELGEAGNLCWDSILRKDIHGLGKSMTDTFLSWRKMLPNTVPDPILKEVETRFLSKYPGAITSGAGGGYVIVISEKPVEGAMKIRVRY